MTGTIVDALQDATAALNNATANVLALEQSLTQQASASQSAATTVINNFLGRPATQGIFCDPVNGLDTNDGQTITTPKKSLDAILANIGITATEVFLMNDALVSIRVNLNGALTILGIQPSNAAPGFIPINRRVTFLGTAVDSPIPLIGTFCSGLFCLSPFLNTNFIDFSLPAQPAGQSYTAHFSSASGTSFSFANGTILVADQTAGQLVGSSNRSTIDLVMTLGAGAAGHVFQGVPAGANPNSQFAYVSNVTSG